MTLNANRVFAAALIGAVLVAVAVLGGLSLSGGSATAAPSQVATTAFVNDTKGQLAGLWTDDMVLSIGMDVCADSDLDDGGQFRTFARRYDAITVRETAMVIDNAHRYLCAQN